MTKPTIQIGHEVREMTDEEYQQHIKDQSDYADFVSEEEDKKTLKEKTLKKLGISAEEFTALLS